MKKLLFYSFLVVSALTSCSKDREPAPAANIEGKWNLSTVKVDVKSVFGNSDETMDYKNKGVYLELKADNKFSGNIVLSENLDELFGAGSMYESTYEQKGDELILKIYDTEYEENLPVKLKIQNMTGSSLVLKFSKAELAELMKEYDKIDGSNENSQMLALISSINAEISFTK